MITLILLLWAGSVSAYAMRVLPRARWVYRSPGLGLGAWYTVIAVVLSAIPAALVAVVGLPGARAAVCRWWDWCVQAVQGAHGSIGGLVAGATALAALVIVGRAARGGWRAGRVLASRRRRYATMLAAGCRHPELGVTVVDDPVPAAFVLPGRHGAVVLTSGALAVLPTEQVAAVLAHERAHVAGRHQLLADTARLLAVAFPTVAVFTHAHEQIDRLLEMRADDVAARRHARLDLARALVAMAQVDRPVPVTVVAATGGQALERVQRLLEPPPALSMPARLTLGTGLAMVVVAPPALFVLAMLFPAAAGCRLFG